MKEFNLEVFNSLKDEKEPNKFLVGVIEMLKETIENENQQKISDILVRLYNFLKTLPNDEIKLLSHAFLYLNKLVKYEIINGDKVLKRYSFIRFFNDFLIDETSRKLLVLETKLRLTPYLIQMIENKYNQKLKK
jgi:hypothetical protein